MNIDDIINKYEERLNLRQVQPPLQRQDFQENVQNLENHIQKVIKPIFDDVQKQIENRKYPCKVYIESQEKQDYNSSIYIYIDSSKLSEKGIQKIEDSDYFSYQLDPINNGFKRNFYTPNSYKNSGVIRNKTVPLSELTEAQIKADLERYLKDVFPSEI